MSAEYYHGGFPGLEVGGTVLPSAETGAPSNADYGAGICRRDRVYVTRVFQDAVVFAAMHPSGRGQVYLVDPVGELAADPDCRLAGASFECERAKVLRVWSLTKKTRDKVRRFLLKSEGLA